MSLADTRERSEHAVQSVRNAQERLDAAERELMNAQADAQARRADGERADTTLRWRHRLCEMPSERSPLPARAWWIADKEGHRVRDALDRLARKIASPRPFVPTSTVTTLAVNTRQSATSMIGKIDSTE